MTDVDAAQPLSGKRVFVGGPIQHALAPNGFQQDLRQLITAAITGLEDAGATVYSAHRVEEFGDQTDHFTPEAVSVRDINWMRKCDVFVPVLPVSDDGVLLRTDGTHIEIGWATMLTRPVVLVTPLPFSETASHLLKGCSAVGHVREVDLDQLRRHPADLVDHVLAVIGLGGRAGASQRSATRDGMPVPAQ